MKEATTPSEAPATPVAATTTTPLPATPAAIPIKTVNRKSSRLPVLSETDNSDLEGTPNPTKKTPHHPSNHSTINTTPSQDTEQLETHDRMSKEKQKFFRTSAFNAEKKKIKDGKKEQITKKNNAKDKISKENDENRTTINKNEKVLNKKNESDRRTRSNDTPSSKKVVTKSKNGIVNSESNKKVSNPLQNTRSQQKNSAMKNTHGVKNKSTPEVPQETVKEEDEEGSSSDDTSSSSSCTSDSDTDSSVDNSDSKASMRNIKIPQIFNVKDKKEPTFGSISGISIDKDAPWGFAAAAAEANSNKITNSKIKSSENLFISVMKEEGLLKDTSDTNSSQDEEKSSELDKNQKSAPGIGQLKGLFDGLSHLFTAPTESRASRAQPNYNPNRRKPRDAKEEESKDVKEEKKDEIVKIELVKVDQPKVEDKPLTKSPSSITSTISNIPKIKSLTSHIPISPKPPVVPKDEVVASMTPSGLVKTAVNSKQHERRKLIKSEVKDVQQKCNNDTIDARTAKKRNHVTTGQVAATNQPMSATLPFTTNNQTGKIGYPHTFRYITNHHLYIPTHSPL